MPVRISRVCAAAMVAFATLSPSVTLAQAPPVSREKVTGALPQLERRAQKVVVDGSVPGLSIAIVHRDEVVYLKGFGLRAVGKPETVDADTVFQLASLSKPLAATTVAALVSEGLVRWDTRIAELDPSFRLADPYPSAELTIRDLFAHRSGLPGEAGNELEGLGFDRATILHRLRLVKPASSFRAGYSYSNFGLTEGAVAAAKPTGKPWETVAEEKLYRPLGMRATSSRHADFMARTNRAALHIPVDGKWVAKIERQPDAQGPAGGVSSNAPDMAQWMRLELGRGTYAGKPLIKPEAIAQTHVPLMERGRNPLTGAASFYGLGWNAEFGRHGESWGHAGAFSVGARTVVTLYPEQQLGIAVLSNAFPTGVPEGLADTFFDLVFDGKVEKDWVEAWTKLYGNMFAPAIAAARARYGKPPATPSPALPLSAYVGRYANEYVGEAVVAEAPGGLVLKLGPQQARSFPLRHFDRDLFLYPGTEELPELPSSLTFRIGPDQKAQEMVVEDFDVAGQGVLRRVGD